MRDEPDATADHEYGQMHDAFQEYVQDHEEVYFEMIREKYDIVDLLDKLGIYEDELDAWLEHLHETKGAEAPEPREDYD